MSEVVRDRSYGVPPVARLVSWGAIIAGTVLALTIQLMLGLLGLGIGLATVDPASGGTASVTTLLSASGIWTLLVVLIGVFAGAYAAGRMAGSPAKVDGLLHGVVTWAVATLFAVYLLTTGVSAVIGSAFGALGSSITTLTQVAGETAPTSATVLPEDLRQRAEALLQQGAQQPEETAGDAAPETEGAADPANQAAGEVDLDSAIDEIVASVQEDASPEERNSAITAISQQAGISRQEAERRLQEFQAQYGEIRQQTVQAADQAAGYVSGTAFAAFVVLILGMITGAVGGAVGRPRLQSS